MCGKPTGSTDGLPFSVAPVKPGTGSGTRVAPVLCVTPHASVSSQEQVYPESVTAVGQESLSEGEASRRGKAVRHSTYTRDSSGGRDFPVAGVQSASSWCCGDGGNPVLAPAFCHF